MSDKKNDSPVFAGHDAPISSRELDDYERWPIAAAISNVIASAPPQWSTRIGLFGSWGDGKTTVLNFLEMQQHLKGNIVVRYSPWGASNEAQVWTDFGKRLRDGLRENGIKLGLLRQIWLWTKEKTKQVALALKGLAALAETSFQVPIPKSAVDATSELIERYVSLSRRDVERMTEALGTKRVIVFIDDLDRSDPTVIPKVLLALRELLDLSKFVFVLAFDRTVVAKALYQYNPAWGISGQEFIDKVIDFPFALPSPTPSLVKTLALRQFKLLCPFVPNRDIDDITSLLPSNPRRLKLFARLISTLETEAHRHEVDELDWPTILIFGMLRIESDEFTGEFVRRVCDEKGFNWMAWLSDRKHTEEQEAELDALLTGMPSIAKDAHPRLKLLVKAWQEKRSFMPGERLRYQVYFASRPHNITWGEFRPFFKEWSKDKKPSHTDSFLKQRADAMDVSRANVADELIQAAIGHYGAILERAGEVKLAEAHAALVAEASDCLDFFKHLFSNGTQGVPSTHFQTADNWNRLVGICINWQHFTANPGESELRSKERQFLVDCAMLVEDPVPFYEAMTPWALRDPVFDERSDRLKNEFAGALRSSLEPRAAARALNLFKEEGGIRRLFSRDEELAYGYLLTAPESPMFSGDLRVQLLDLIDRSPADLAIRRNTLDYLDLLVRALRGNDRFCSIDDRKKFLVKHADLVGKLWETAVSAPRQYRYLDGMRKQRDELLGAGVMEDKLIQPDWLLRKHVD